MEEKEKETKKKIQLDVDEDTAQGIYANLVMVNFNEEEFITDYAFLQPQINKGRILSRVILTPKNLKRLEQLLRANIEAYEQKFGPIDEPPQAGIQFSVN